MDIFSGTRTRLTRHDLIAYEQLLADAVSRFLSFKSYSLYFPRTAVSPEAIWDASDRKVLLPLVLNGKVLAVFVARGVKLKAPKTMLALYPAMAEMAVEKLMLYKMSITDPATALFSRQHMQQTMQREIELIRECFKPTSDGRCDIASVGHRACMGVVVFTLHALKMIVRDYGYLFADSVAATVADTLRDNVPEQALVARTGDVEFSVFLPSGTPRSCRKLAKNAVNAMRAIRVQHELTEDSVGVNVCAGYAAYPQDFEGVVYEKPIEEQARLLLRKARIAAGIANEKGLGEATEFVMGYNRIPVEGGKVNELLPMNRVMVNLGHSMGVREGERFSIWAIDYTASSGETPPPSYKGELVLMEVRETQSLAEIMHVGDPTWPVAVDDRITLLPEDKGVTEDGDEGKTDPLTGLLRHRDFLARLSKEREACDSFAVSLIRLTGGSSPEKRSPHPEQMMAQASELCQDILSSVCEKSFGGRYGLNSLIYFHADVAEETLRSNYVALCEELERKLHIEAAVGVSCYPFLSYRKGDALENCLKALEYAMLLPKPRVGIMDSLALNISADKLFSKGDTFEAIDEYKRALLADENNTMAWNSLGVCYAGLGRQEEARKHFEQALSRNKKDVMALYNLGHICHGMGDFAEARIHYRKCLKQDPKHVFAYIRLGQLSEAERKFGIARQYYNKAAKLEENLALVHRHLARLSMRQGRLDEAREELHQVLLHNPQDAIALQLMAKLYLDAGEDPEIAEVMARQAAALRPDLKGAWLELARAFEARGNSKGAHDALIKAGEL